MKNNNKSVYTSRGFKLLFFFLFVRNTDRWRWPTVTTSTVSWSICSRSTSAQVTQTPANGNGWLTSTETHTAPTWAISTFSITSPSLRTRARLGSALTWWRRCCSRVVHHLTNLKMLRTIWTRSLQPDDFCSFSAGRSNIETLDTWGVVGDLWILLFVNQSIFSLFMLIFCDILYRLLNYKCLKKIKLIPYHKCIDCIIIHFNNYKLFTRN